MTKPVIRRREEGKTSKRDQFKIVRADIRGFLF